MTARVWRLRSELRNVGDLELQYVVMVTFYRRRFARGLDPYIAKNAIPPGGRPPASKPQSQGLRQPAVDADCRSQESSGQKEPGGEGATHRKVKPSQ